MSIRPIFPDLSFNNLGAFVLMTPNSPAATDWLADNLAGEVLIFRGAIVVEPRYLESIVTGARAAGLTVEG